MKTPFVILIVLVGLATELHAVTIATVPIGNPGNANDPLTGNLYGGVAYEYRIGTTEVTNAQYVEFLNAKAASDPLSLYSAPGEASPWGGITRSGSEGSYSYASKPNMANKPVNYVSWYDAIRFVNWLNNGQGNADTETGAYTLLGGSEEPSNGKTVARNVAAIWFLPSEDEWYKAAYHQPASQGGDSDEYWLYTTATNSNPTPATADIVGNISNPGFNVINFAGSADWNGQNGNLTTVGSAGSLSQGFYGTSDQGGNVWEYNEELFDIEGNRGLRGGAYDIDVSGIRSSSGRASNSPRANIWSIGFRVATIPEPSTYALAAIGVIGLLVFRRRTR